MPDGTMNAASLGPLNPEQQLIRDRAQSLLDALVAVVPRTTMHYAVTDLQDRHLPTIIRLAGTIKCTPDAATPAEVKTWTFFGHWENDRIVVEWIEEGEVQDDREDTGAHEQGLWAASAQGPDIPTAQATAIAEYEDALQ